MFRVLCIFILLTVSQTLYSTEKGNLIVKIYGIENDKGQMIVDLHNKNEAFPMDRESAYRQIKTDIKEGTAEVIFDDIEYGSYAVAAHHDEDGDGEVDTNFIGMPSEDLKASRNASGSFGPPDFEDAMIKLDKKSKTINIYFDR